MSNNSDYFNEETEVILNLLDEIHTVCHENGIKYYIADDLFLLAYEEQKANEIIQEDDDTESDDEENTKVNNVAHSDDVDEDEIEDTNAESINIRSGMILMHPADFLRFSTIMQKELPDNRAFEWMGTNPEYAGLFARYIDKTTTYYSPTRLCFEKHLGMFVTINIIRPRDSKKIRHMWTERFWRDWVMGFEPTRKKSRIVFGMFELYSSLFGRERLAKKIANKLLSIYSKTKDDGFVWIKRELRLRTYEYPSKLFSEQETVEIGDRVFTTVNDIEEYQSHARRRATSLTDRISTFCDTTIGYRDLELDDFRDSIDSFVRYRENFIKIPQIRRYRSKWKKMLRLLIRSYYRYYYAITIADSIDRFEDMLANDQTELLEEELSQYKDAIMAYGNVYINDRLNKIMIQLYGDEIEKKLANRPEIFNEGIKVYDYTGKYIGTIGDNNDRD